MNINKKLSPNKSSREGIIPDMIVDHITEGTYASAISWLCDTVSQASAHFIVAQDGRITQLVDIKDKAWGNGTSTIPTSKVYYGKSKSALIRQRASNANNYTVSIEHEGIYGKTHGALTDAQFAATLELHKFIRSEIKRIYGTNLPADANHIIGHCSVAPITKPNCPGELYPFNRIIAGMAGTVVTAAPVQDTKVIYPTGASFNPYILEVQKVINTMGIATLLADGKGGTNTLKALDKVCVKRGDKNALVGWVQKMFNIKVDNSYGNAPYHETYDKIIAYQKNKGLTVDGTVGKNTILKMCGYN